MFRGLRACLPALAGVALIPLTAQANSAGRPGADVAEMGCGSGLGCHDGNGTSPTVALVVPSVIAAGQTVELQVIVDGDGMFTGITAATDDGDLVGDNETTRGVLNSVTQNGMPVEYVDGQATFTMAWTAPDAEGTYTLFASANNADGDRTITNDAWTTASAELVVGGEPMGGEGGAGGEPVGGEGGAPIGGEGGGQGGAMSADGGVEGGDDDDGGDGSCQTASGRAGAGWLLLLALGGLLRRRRA